MNKEDRAKVMSDEDFAIYQTIRGKVEYLQTKYGSTGRMSVMAMLIDDCGDGED